MTFWIVTYTHREGVSSWPVFQEAAPDLEIVAAGLDDWEPNWEGLDLDGPFTVPVAQAA